MKSLITGILFTGCTTFAVAHPVSYPGDTTRKETPRFIESRDLPVVVLQQANVVFPENLSGHEKEAIDYIETFSQKRRDYLIRMYQKGKQFFPKVQSIFRKYDVPDEFRVLMALESGFNAKALSSAGAYGYWQIMDAVAREYGMKIARKSKVVAVRTKSKKGKNKKNSQAIVKASKSALTDDRTHFIKSTTVAARYLKDRSRNLNNDWLLIAASYNCGVGNVWNAMERCGKKDPGFWDIRNLLPAETRAYVMNFIALNVIFHNYDAFSRNQLCFRDVICIDDSAEECADEELPAAMSLNASL